MSESQAITGGGPFGFTRPIQSWLRQRVFLEGLWNFAIAVVFQLSGLLVLLANSAIILLLLLFLDNSLRDFAKPFLGQLPTLPIWGWGTLVIGGVGLLFLGNVRFLPQFMGRIPWRAEESSSLFLGLCFMGPWLITAGILTGRKGLRLWTLDVAACAWILTILFRRGHRVSFHELAELVPWCNPIRVFPQLRDLDGVVFLTREPAGVSLTDELRAELWPYIPGADPFQPDPGDFETHDWDYAQAKARTDETVTPSPRPERSEYDLLGIGPASTLEEIKTAYRRCIKEAHPDRFVGLGAEMQALAEERSKALNAAYEKLRLRHAAG